MRRSPSGRNRLAAEASGERWRSDRVLAVRAPLPLRNLLSMGGTAERPGSHHLDQVTVTDVIRNGPH